MSNYHITPYATVPYHLSSVFCRLSPVICPLSSALYKCRESSTNQPFLCKTNPILSAVGGLQMNLSAYIKTAYENIRNWTLGQNKPNSNPIKPNSNPILSAVGGLQMSVSIYCTKDYRKNDCLAAQKTNPIQSQFKPNQSQNRPYLETTFSYPEYYGIPFLEGNYFSVFLLFVCC